MFRIGFGTDLHRLVAGRPLVIGGIEIDSDLGAEGHSDADVLLHAITDAVLGSLALGDIGQHFANTDYRWKDAESSRFLSYAVEQAHERGYRIVNIDSTIELEAPKLRPYIAAIRQNVAGVCEIEAGDVSVKAKTGEKVDAVGERRAIRAEAVVLLTRSAG